MADKDTAAAPAAAAEPARADLIAQVRKLYHEHFSGSIVAQDTPRLNHCHDFLTKLEAILVAAA